MHIKNVQALLKLGADVNQQDADGNTPLHLCVISLESAPDSFEKLKNIGKELLFSGASRTQTNNQGKTAGDLLDSIREHLDDLDFRKMKYVLTQPTGRRWLRMTRPIEKVSRDNTL